jgi:hypothetical protein
MLPILNFNKTKITQVFFLVIIFIPVLSFSSETSSFSELSSRKFEALKKAVQLEPSLITRRQKLLRVISADQLAETIYAMSLNHHSFLYPVRLKGEKLTALLGRDLRQLSVMAIWNGKLQAIPFQFEEYDSKSGYVYLKGINPFPIEGREYFLDGGDELTFMYRDAGIERYQVDKHSLSEGKLEQELEFKDVEGRKRYAYIVSGSSERSDLDYVDTPIDSSTMQSSFYHMSYAPNNFLEIQDFRPHVGTASDERVVDMIYFKVSANIFSKLIKVSLNSRDNIRVKVLGAKDGPVRSVLFLKISVLLAKIPVFSMFSEINIYEQGMVMPNRTEVGKGALFTRIFKNPEILIFLDMHGLKGGKVSADAFSDDNGKLRYGSIDGKMDELEQHANNIRKPGEWIWLNSGLGWDIFMTLSFPEEKFEGMETSLYYLDNLDKKTEGESFPGAEPRLGLRIEGLPKNIKKLENLDLEYAFWYPDSVGKKGPRDFYKHLSNPPVLTIKTLKE